MSVCSSTRAPHLNERLWVLVDHLQQLWRLLAELLEDLQGRRSLGGGVGVGGCSWGQKRGPRDTQIARARLLTVHDARLPALARDDAARGHAGGARRPPEQRRRAARATTARPRARCPRLADGCGVMVAAPDRRQESRSLPLPAGAARGSTGRAA